MQISDEKSDINVFKLFSITHLLIILEVVPPFFFSFDIYYRTIQTISLKTTTTTTVCFN